ncbi:glutathione S-transferase family protein [Variovorax saccharolyticus]|uniref:glutathione S-transferase family protein n=1 Tax=Variovorax saccharolyticus TaxID=3053516 RepID=UPI0025759C89|nr:glutathione S-transferase [Variovorax sp. J22R187]MDM0017521.1 glutathione S-transferase [Variovorax sp. J22R187]
MSAPRPAAPIQVYSSAISGHSHRVRLFLSLLGLPFETREVDLRAGEQKRPDFLRRNAFGQVPVIEDGDVTVCDSNAILVYLNERYAVDPARWLPREGLAAAQVQRWLSVAAGQLAAGPSVARVIVLFGLARDPADAIARSHDLLRVMEGELATRPFLAGTSATLADISNYSYVAHAPEGNVSLDPYPEVRAWLARIEALPGFVPMVASRIGLRA